MSLSILKPALVAVAVLALPVAASAHGTCKPARAVHKVAYKTHPKPVKVVRVRAAIPPCCNTRTVVRYVPAPPPPPVVRRIVVYRDRPEPVFVRAPYVDEGPFVESRYAARRAYVHHEYHRRDIAYDGRWRHYDWRDDGPY
jgi:hypothetical protein